MRRRGSRSVWAWIAALIVPCVFASVGNAGVVQPIAQCRARVIATQTGQGCCEPAVNVCDYIERIVASDCSGACPVGRVCAAVLQQLDVVYYYKDCGGACPGSCSTLVEITTTDWVILACDCEIQT